MVTFKDDKVFTITVAVCTDEDGRFLSWEEGFVAERTSVEKFASFLREANVDLVPLVSGKAKKVMSSVFVTSAHVHVFARYDVKIHKTDDDAYESEWSPVPYIDTFVVCDAYS